MTTGLVKPQKIMIVFKTKNKQTKKQESWEIHLIQGVEG